MKIFQVLVAQDGPDMAGMSAFDVRDDALMPNPLYLTLQGAKDYVLRDVNESREDVGESPLPWLDWVEIAGEHEETERPRIRHYAEESGLTYDIVTMEVEP